MDKTALIDAILEKEWPMFHNVNGEERASCQNDYPVFEIMRRAQYDAWSPEALESYLADVTAAAAEGRNLAREKYIRSKEQERRAPEAGWVESKRGRNAISPSGATISARQGSTKRMDATRPTGAEGSMRP